MTSDFVYPTADQLNLVRSLYDQGQILPAYELAVTYGPLKQWRGASARVLAARLASHLGAGRLGYFLIHYAYQEEPNHPEATYYYARNIFARHGPLATWQFLQKFATPDGYSHLPDAEPELQADWHALHSTVLGFFRDFEPAERYIDRALEISPDKPWVWIERADLLEREDRYDDSMQAAQRAMSLRPNYRPGVQQVAHLLQLLDRDPEALELLQAASQQLQSSAVVSQLAMLQTELGQHAEARQSWDRVAELSPMADKHFRQFLAARQSDSAYLVGDIPRAIELGLAAKGPFFKKVIENLQKAGPDAKRVLLPVPFVRQHHVTCAPATLSALSRFWSMPAEHLSVAEAICYDGTPAHSERGWAQSNGYHVREFRVTWESAMALIDRGIPFTLTTVESTSAHLQAVIGYDSRRGTLLIRDPFLRMSSEFASEAFFERYGSSGPRGMAMVPKDRADLLDGIDLPEADLYDRTHALMHALVNHRRQDAQREYDALAAADTGHRLTVGARRSLAAYDGDHAGALAAIDDQLKLFPNDAGLTLQRLSYLGGLGQRQERLAVLQEMINGKSPDPVFLSNLAMELKDDARDHIRAMRLARKAIRASRGDPRNYQTLAHLLWDESRRKESLQLYRFAAAMDDKNENFAQSYFIASMHLKRTPEVFRLLRDRFQRFGRKSASPLLVLFWAYEQTDQTTEAFAALDQALEWRPDDGELLLQGANAHARYGQFERAQELLDRAKNKSRPASWLRGAAEIATFRGESDVARDLWQQLLEAEPLAFDAHRHIAVLLAQANGPIAAIEHLRSACARFPYNLPLGQLYLGWLADEGAADAEADIRKHLAVHPTDTKTRRQLVWVLGTQQKLAEAQAEADELLVMDPQDPANHHLAGRVRAAQGDDIEARAAYRRAIEISIDADYAVNDLVMSCDNVLARREQLEFVRDQLVKQTLLGDGLLAFRAVAADTFSPEELLTELQQALAARPDLWHAHAAVMKQLLEMNRLDEAAAAGETAVRKFPLLPRLWLELSIVHRIHNDSDAEVAALEKALALSPGWAPVLRQLSEAFERRGELERASSLLESAVARDPLDGISLGYLADIRWKLGDREAALAHIGKAVTIDPSYQWAWDALRRWSDELKKPEAAEQLARELTKRRSREARSWLVLARTLPIPEQTNGNGEPPPDERLDAVAKALELNPRSVDAHDLKALLLFSLGRVPEARKACRPTVFGAQVPVELRSREAWILHNSGEPADAKRRMKKILDDDPGYQAGWYRLLDWHRQADDKEAFTETSTAMVKLWPHDPIALIGFGDAKLAQHDRDAARQAYQRAIEIAPDHFDGLLSLYDLVIGDANLEEADQLLTRAERLSANAYTKARRIDLWARQGQHDAALSAMGELCQETPDEWPLRHGIGGLMDAGRGNEVEKVLANAAKQSTCAPLVGELLILVMLEQKHEKQFEATTDSLINGDGLTPPAITAIEKVLNLLCERAREQTEPGWNQVGVSQIPAKVLRTRSRRLLKYIYSRETLLRSNVNTWGTVGYVLHTLRDYPRAANWLNDWQSRPDAAGWMLVNAAEALRAQGRDAEAAPINVRGYEIAVGRPRAMHGLWIAFDALCAGDTEKVRTQLDAISAEMQEVQESYIFLNLMIQATNDVLTADDVKQGLWEAKAKVREAVSQYPTFSRDKELRRAYVQCLRIIANSGVGIGGQIWCLMQRV